ncbi:MAG: DoxX family protein [Muribaculaceae bacterium]|nr:DoxX family protein [Muribaculaceae bacterium]
MTKNKLVHLNHRFMPTIIWGFRIIVGITFVFSGLSKMIDLWGFIYKIEQYLNVWQIPQPRSLTFFTAIMLSGVEFIIGFMTLTGSFKRTSAWLSMLVMLFMLPLSAYIAIAKPVDDCGCFGDALIISNTATFIKNIALFAMSLYLSYYNHKVTGLYTTYSQWLQSTIAIAYILIVGFIGYSLQPLIDFRPFKVGSELKFEHEDSDESATTFKYIYAKNGHQEYFTIDNLPDSSWTYIDRISDAQTAQSQEWIVVRDENGEPAYDIISSDGPQLILLIPEIDNADIASTYLINEINRHIIDLGGNLIALIGTDAKGIQEWRDIALASYPIYSVEDSYIKEIARGNVSLVYLFDGIIKWKRTLYSIEAENFNAPNDTVFEELEFSGNYIFGILTAIFGCLEFILWCIDRSGRAVKSHLTRKNQKKSVTL